MTDISAISQALLNADSVEVDEKVKAALDEGADANDILQNGLIRGMNQVGQLMEEGEMFIPEVMQRAQIMAGAVEILRPYLKADKITSGGKIVFGTVKGDLHDIGKNLVALLLKSSGFDVVDLGVDVSPENFVAAIKDNQPDILAMSALLTTTMEMMAQTIDSVKEAGLREKIKIMVGGAPVNQKYSDRIGADGFASDAGSACRLAKSLMRS